LTITGLAAAIIAATSQADTIVSLIESRFGASPYLFVLASYRYELVFLFVVATVAYYLYDSGFFAIYPRLRMNWATQPVSLWRLQLHPEEWTLLAVVLALGFSLLAHSYFKAARVYQAYGLHFVADKLCKGDFDAALARMKALKANPLWERYRSQLNSAIERNTYIKELVDKRLANFQANHERESPEARLAEAMELKVIFGSNAGRTIDLGRGPTATDQWRRFLSETKC
jgi:hypothetical protein